jgi:hypothetical protein
MQARRVELVGIVPKPEIFGCPALVRAGTLAQPRASYCSKWRNADFTYVSPRKDVAGAFTALGSVSALYQIAEGMPGRVTD